MEAHKELPKICVVVRKRPLSKKEIQKNELDILEKRGPCTIVAKECKTNRAKVDLTKFIEEHHFNFDKVFDDAVDNEELYSEVVQPLVCAAFQGTKVTCFAYGQTGSGKTYTMIGPPNEEIGCTRVPGLFLLASNDIFTLKETHKMNLEIWVSFYEIYCGKLYDLLNQRNLLFLREDAKQNVNIVGLSEKQVGSVAELMEVIAFGLSARTTGVTGANVDSSRSHGILQITMRDMKGRTQGKISFIDLAGSERGADTLDQNKQTRMDGAEINKSLLALKECIRALDQDKRHTPFRGSKLTLVLKDSFMGNCKTLMIANVSPSGGCCEHTLNTLRYADRVKELRKGPTSSHAPVDQYDNLSKALMLPRQANNITRIPMSKQTKATVAIGALPSRSPVKKQPGLPQRPQTQPNGRHYNVAITTGSGLPGNEDLMLGAIQALKSYAPEPQVSEQGGNREEVAKVIDKLTDDALEGPEGTSELQKLSEEHEKLIDVILEEEDQLIEAHKRHIDAVMELAKKEMALLQEVSKPGSDIDDYVKGLNAILEHKLEIISVLRSRLLGFYYHLRQEEDICKKVNDFQQHVTKGRENDLETDLLKDDVNIEDFDNPNV